VSRAIGGVGEIMTVRSSIRVNDVTVAVVAFAGMTNEACKRVWGPVATKMIART
jgi:hypothetical protein